MMVHTTELEREITAGSTYFDCFKRVDLRRTEVVCLVWAAQNLCGAGMNIVGLSPVALSVANS